MNAKKGFKRFIALFLSFAIVLTTFAGLLPGGLVLAADETPGMHIIIKHWHVGGLDSSEYTITSESKVITPVAGSSETFAGFAVSAGNDCVKLEKGTDTLTVTYSPNVHLVKVHVFYSEKPKLVPGTEMRVGTGSESELNKGEYEDTSTQKWGELDKSLQENIKKALGDDGIIDPDSLESDDLIKLYDTSEGLHTGKTATAVCEGAGTTLEDNEENGTRVFDINLEAWYNYQATAKVGLILDASGSMAFISNGLEPMHFNVSEDQVTLPDGTKVKTKQYLTLERVKQLLDTNLTDNSKLSYSD